MKVSIIIPIYNEQNIIENVLKHFSITMNPEIKNKIHEVLLVENGSMQITFEKTQTLEKLTGFKIKLLSVNEKIYGNAIKLGMLQAQGSHVCILECDFLDNNFLSKSVDYFSNHTNHKFILASKLHKDSIDQRPFSRKIITLLFNSILKIIFNYEGSDTHGLKFIEANYSRKLCALSMTS